MSNTLTEAEANVFKVVTEKFNIKLHDISYLCLLNLDDVIKLLNHYKKQYDTETDKNACELYFDCILYLSSIKLRVESEMILYRNRE